MMDGMKMAGMIRYFYDHKGFGLSDCTGAGGSWEGGRTLKQDSKDFGDFCVFFLTFTRSPGACAMEVTAAKPRSREAAKLRFYKCDWESHRHLFPRP